MPGAYIRKTSPNERSGEIRGSSSSSSLSISLPGTSRDGHSKHGRSATYWQSVAQIGYQVADALDYAHKQGVLHRDIKPSNLLLDVRGTVWVTDFGLAKADDQQNITHTGDILGTLRYMPPEAFEGKSDARGDVYALGMTLYEMVALRPAFDQKDRGTLIRQVTHEEPPRLSKLRAEIPRDLETIVHKAIDRDPSHRYASADLLADDLQRFLDDEPIQARRLSALERLGRWRRRNARLAMAIALAVAALVLGTVFSTGFAVLAMRSASAARAESARQAAARGLGLIAAQDAGRGMLWLVRAMDLDPEDASGVHRAVRVNLSRAAREQIPTHRLTLKPEGARPGVAGVESAEGVRTVAFSPDGRVVATLHKSNVVRLWDAGDGHLVCPPIRHDDPTVALAFSQDGRRLWTASVTGQLESATGDLTPEGSRTPRAERSESKSQAPRSRFWTWDVASGRPLGEARNLPGSVAAIRADGALAAVALSTNTLQIVDLNKGLALGPPMVDESHISSGTQEVAFSPDGGRLATGESNDQTIGTTRAALIRDVETGRVLCTTSAHDGYHIYAVTWSPDGRNLATGGHDCMVRIWDPTTGVLRGLPRSLPLPIAQLAYSPDGRILAAALTGQIGNSRFSRSRIRLLDASTLLPVGPDWRFDVGVASIAFDPDGTSLAVGLSDGTSQIWSLPDPLPALRPIMPGSSVYSLAIGSDGTMAMGTTAGDVYLRDPQTEAIKRVYQSPGFTIWDLAMSTDRRTLAIGVGFNISTYTTENVGYIALLDINTLKLVCPIFLVGEPVAIPYCFSHDGTVLYTKGRGASLRRWDARTGKNLGRDIATPNGTSDIALSADEQHVFLSDQQGHVRRRDLAAGTDLDDWALQKQAIYRLGISSSQDGETLVTLSDDWSARCWDAKTGAALGPPIEHNNNSSKAALHRDGRTLVIGTSLGEIEFWDVPTGLPLGPAIRLGADLTCEDLGFIPGGNTLAFVASGQVFLYEIPSGVTGTRDEVRRWAEVCTGWSVDPSGTVAQLAPPNGSGCARIRLPRPKPA